jgi:outer membrane protein assembly factor BamD (BamD/ComL family)
MMRYKITIDRHGLGEYEKSIVDYVFESTSPKDAIRRVQSVYDRCERTRKRIPYNSKLFLEAVAISADVDLAKIK